LSPALPEPKVIHACFSGNGCGCQRIVTGDHDGLDAHAPQFGKTFPNTAFNNIL